MSLLVRLLRLFYPWVLDRAESAAFSRALKDESAELDALRASPITALMRADPDWDLVESSCDPTFQNSPNPSQCECGDWYTSTNAKAFFAAKPNQQDITNLLATIDYPDGKTRPACEGECISVRKKDVDEWGIYKNNKTGQFMLNVAKSRMWHCELPIKP